jgi:hypothetical protein
VISENELTLALFKFALPQTEGQIRDEWVISGEEITRKTPIGLGARKLGVDV